MAAAPFPHVVGAAWATIPFGEVRTSGDVAASVVRPRVRLAGNANHVNPYPVVVPCHRVVATNDLGGYGGGDEVQRLLLAPGGRVLRRVLLGAQGLHGHLGD